MSDQRIFITGGGSGLGRALAERYGQAGWKVCIGDLSLERCAETLASLGAANVVCQALACDVTKEADLEAAAAWLKASWGGVDIVVNNAGVANAGGIADVSMADWQWIVDVNLLGVVRGCKVFTPLFQAQKRGHFVNIASAAGLIHPPRCAAYNATKAAVVALSETLELELADDGIGVSVVCPAFFRTGLATGSQLRTSDAESRKLVERLVNKAKVAAPEIADAIFRGVEKGDFHVITHRETQAIWWLKRLLPHELYKRALKEGMRKMSPRKKKEQAA
jgi:NAD(P)-dependent dehydrogenase (short-subunit alcohol dehydrogenase family)